MCQVGHLQELKLLLINDGFNTGLKIMSIKKPITGNREKLDRGRRWRISTIWKSNIEVRKFKTLLVG